MIYTIEMDDQTRTVIGEPHLTFRQVLAVVKAPVKFPLRINGYKVLERDNLDRTLPAEY